MTPLKFFSAYATGFNYIFHEEHHLHSEIIGVIDQLYVNGLTYQTEFCRQGFYLNADCAYYNCSLQGQVLALSFLPN